MRTRNRNCTARTASRQSTAVISIWMRAACLMYRVPQPKKKQQTPKAAEADDAEIGQAEGRHTWSVTPDMTRPERTTPCADDAAERGQAEGRPVAGSRRPCRSVPHTVPRPEAAVHYELTLRMTPARPEAARTDHTVMRTADRAQAGTGRRPATNSEAEGRTHDHTVKRAADRPEAAHGSHCDADSGQGPGRRPRLRTHTCA